MSEGSNLEAFYGEAMSTIKDLAKKYQLFAPEGLARVEGNALHWRLTVTECDPETYWAALWHSGAQVLGITCEAAPGDTVVDQEGNQWVLVGLDPSSDEFPVRLKSLGQEPAMISASSASLLQVIELDEPSEEG